MNKLTKATIAGAVGVALLLGGAGTLATWNSSASISGGTIVSGNLLVDSTSTAAGYWQLNGGSKLATPAFTVVPGDVVTYTKTVNVTATGDNLVATLGLGTASITAAPATATGSTQIAAQNAANSALAAYLNASAVLTATGTSITGTGTGPYTVTAGTAGISAQPVVVTATITFPKSGTAGVENAAESGTVNLANLTIALTQN
jgi:alternate signal-mediated exported protein